MTNKNGNLSINSDNIFPIIKKWLYSDHDIFYRELVSNGCDAVTKLKKLSLLGEFSKNEDENFFVRVIVNPDEKTIKFIDNGIGMTEDEVEEYINQIAFSGAEAFIEKYKDKATNEQIIGHFGLGFYSAFMVADKVTIDTLSYKDNAQAVYWECDGGIEFFMSDSKKESRGTEITLYLSDDCYEFSNEFRAKEVLEKYCSFMPVEIYLENTAKADDENADAEVLPINTTTPLWAKHPNECTKEEYIDFYRKTFKDFKEPLFWIHLNMDYPFNLKGILYFPKINMEYESASGVIKLYNNQVFIADNIKEVIPEFLMLLKGAIDCPDLPLNVSRSALQNDGFVKKISDYITKKVADKLSGMCKTDRENYEKYWDDINPFIKYGCLNDEKFREKMKDFILYKTLNKDYVTIPDWQESNKDNEDKTIYYVTDEVLQSQYINMFKQVGLNALLLPHPIDQPYISQMENENEDIKFARIDAGITSTFKETGVDTEELDNQYKPLVDTFKKVMENDDLFVVVERLKDENISSMITLPEENRRMQDMMKAYGVTNLDSSVLNADETLVLNANNALVKYIFENPDSENVPTICRQLYDLARIAHRPLLPDEMTAFIERSNEILAILAK